MMPGKKRGFPDGVAKRRLEGMEAGPHLPTSESTKLGAMTPASVGVLPSIAPA